MIEAISTKLLSLIIISLYILIIFISKLIELLETFVSSLETRKSHNKPQMPTPADNMAELKVGTHYCRPSFLPEAVGELKAPHRLRNISGDTLAETLEEFLDMSVQHKTLDTDFFIPQPCMKHEGYRYFRSISPIVPQTTIRKQRQNLKDGCILCLFRPLKSNSTSPNGSDQGRSHVSRQSRSESKSYVALAETSSPENDGSDLGNVIPFTELDCIELENEGHRHQKDPLTLSTVPTDQKFPESMAADIPPMDAGPVTTSLAALEAAAIKDRSELLNRMSYPTANMQSGDNIRVVQNFAMELSLPEEEGDGLSHVFPFLSKHHENAVTTTNDAIVEDASDLEVEEGADIGEMMTSQTLISLEENSHESNTSHHKPTPKGDSSIVSREGSRPAQGSLLKSNPDEEDDTSKETAEEAEMATSDLGSGIDEASELPAPLKNPEYWMEVVFIPLEEGFGLGHVFPFLNQINEDGSGEAENNITSTNVQESLEGGAKEDDINETDVGPTTPNVVEPCENDIPLAESPTAEGNVVAPLKHEPGSQKVDMTVSKPNIERANWQSQDPIESQPSRFDHLIKELNETTPQNVAASSDVQQPPNKNKDDGNMPKSNATRIFTEVPSPLFDQPTPSPTSPPLDPKVIDMSWSPDGLVEFSAGSGSDGASSPTQASKSHYNNGTPSKKSRSAPSTNDSTIPHTVDPKLSSTTVASPNHSEPAPDVPKVPEAAKLNKTQKRNLERKRAKALKKARLATSTNDSTISHTVDPKLSSTTAASTTQFEPAPAIPEVPQAIEMTKTQKRNLERKRAKALKKAKAEAEAEMKAQE